MPMPWPFGRRGGGKAVNKLKEGRASAVAAGHRPVAASGLSANDAARNDIPRKASSRRSSRRKRRSSHSTTSMRDVEKDSPSLRPVDAPFAKESGPPHSSTEHITALPLQKRLEQSPHLRPISQQHGIPYNFHPNSHSSLPTARERGKLQRPQSLRKTVNESALVRRKSSKKKRENDPVREEEIRAMSMPLPQKRPAGNSGGMLRRDSKKVKGPINRRFERPTSDVSLPLEDSTHSSMSGSSESRAFRVSALDMIAPRPTIRYSVGAQQGHGALSTSPTSYHTKNESRRDQRLTNSREGKESKRNSRIDDLADDLDAGALREILERDKRRREKKRKAEEDRLRRRLERRAEKQRAAEVGGTPSAPRREAKGAVGLGIEQETSTPMEDVRPSTPPQTQTVEKSADNSQLPTPLESPVEEPVVSNAQAVRYSRGSVQPPVHTRGHSNVSEMPELLSEKLAQETPVTSVETTHDANGSGSLHPMDTADTAATPKKGSSRRRSSEGKRMGVFASLFRRGKRSSQDQPRATPSEASFSNTSRESMSRQPLPAHLAATAPSAPIPIKRPSSVPRRTMSKFREDLPEFPLSPPDSRVQSPEVPSGIAARRRSQQPADLQFESHSSGNVARTDSPVSPGVPAAGLMSQSLASVDSEGSWLSGKPMNRRSNKSHMRSSVGSASVMKRNDDFTASYEELGMTDDEYFKRLTPGPEERRNDADRLARKASSTAIAADPFDDEAETPFPRPTSEEEEEEELVKSGVARQPTIIHRQARVKSTEALLSYFQDDKAPAEGASATAEVSSEQDSPTSEGEPVSVQRARSVDLGKHHVRHLSAGSAKLLDIQKRSSLSSQNKPSQQE